MDRRGFLERVGASGVAIGVPVALAGCVEEDHDVGMIADGFVPDELAIPVGGTVVWENTSTRTHTVTAYEGGIPDDAEYFASGGYDDEETARAEWHADFGGSLENGDRFAHTFDVPGRYDYVCIPHEDGGMYATIYVEE